MCLLTYDSGRPITSAFSVSVPPQPSQSAHQLSTPTSYVIVVASTSMMHTSPLANVSLSTASRWNGTGKKECTRDWPTVCITSRKEQSWAMNGTRALSSIETFCQKQPPGSPEIFAVPLQPGHRAKQPPISVPSVGRVVDTFAAAHAPGGNVHPVPSVSPHRQPSRAYTPGGFASTHCRSDRRYALLYLPKSALLALDRENCALVYQQPRIEATELKSRTAASETVTTFNPDSLA